MPYDPSQASRNYAANAHRQHMQAHNRIAQHGRQAQARQFEFMRSRHGGGPRGGQRGGQRGGTGGSGLEFPGDETASDTRRRPRRSRRIGVVLLVVVALVAGVWLVLGEPGFVRPGTEWNVRRGPGTGYASVGVVGPGQVVTASCRQGGWVRITTPTTGFVYERGLALLVPPPRC